MFTFLKTLADTTLAAPPGTVCDPTKDKGVGDFLGLPHWYQYLPGHTDTVTGKCIPYLSNWNDAWAIALAIVDILLRVGGIIAVVFVIYGGFQYMTSQGEPERTGHAKDTILNAFIGLAIIIIAILVVNFIGNTIK